MKKKIAAVVLTLALIPSFVACASTDVIGNGSVDSFQEVLTAMEKNVTKDQEKGGWSLVSPDGAARFIWSSDYRSTNPYDVMLEFDAEPFLDAGLDSDKLPAGILREGKILVGSDLGNENPSNVQEDTPLASYKTLVEQHRDRLKYHGDLDHYGINAGNGNMFEWAKDMSTNDKDIVFVADPEIFINAGVEPEKVEGWIFAKVKVMDERGKSIEVDKFLKPFSIQ